MSSQISVTLSPDMDPIWRACFDVIHQMKIAKPTRRIFPTLEYCISGLDPSKMYKLCFQLVFVDDKEVTFRQGKWVETISTEAKDAPPMIWIEELSGEKLMNEIVSFDHLRITNQKSREDKDNMIIHLHGLRRYIPVLTIVEGDNVIHTAVIPHTLFVTGTQFHNKELIAIKNANNKYSKSGRRRHHEEQDVDQPAEKREKEDITTTSHAPITQNADILDQLNLAPTVTSQVEPVEKPGKAAMLTIPSAQITENGSFLDQLKPASANVTQLKPVENLAKVQKSEFPSIQITQNESLLEQFFSFPMIQSHVKPDVAPMQILPKPVLPVGHVKQTDAASHYNSRTPIFQYPFLSSMFPMYNPTLPPFSSVRQVPAATPEQEEVIDGVNTYRLL